jgi:predicted ATPase
MPTLYLRDVELKRQEVPSFSRYPFNLPSVLGLERIAFTTPVTFFIGENGSGKSTIMEAIAVALGFNAEGGSKNFNFSTRASHSELHEYVKLGRGPRPEDSYFLRAESLFNVATQIELLDAEGGGPPIGPAYGERPLHEQSHGEAFLALFENRFRGTGLYLLDEPEAALSPLRQMTLLAHIHGLVRTNAQFIVATHSPILLAYPGAVIYEFTADGIRTTTYEETDHFRITRDFLNRYPSMLRTLFADDEG